MAQLQKYNFMVPQPDFAAIKKNAMTRRIQEQDMRIKQNKMLQDQMEVQRKQKKHEIEMEKARLDVTAKKLKLTADKQDQFFDIIDGVLPMVDIKEVVNPETGKPDIDVDLESLEAAKHTLYPMILELYDGDTEKANLWMQEFDKDPRFVGAKILQYRAQREAGVIRRKKKEDKPSSDYERWKNEPEKFEEYKRKTRAPKGDKDKPEYKPGQALEKIAQTKKQIAQIKKTGVVDPFALSLLKAIDPEAAEKAAQGDTTAEEVIKALKESIRYLEKFAPAAENDPLRIR